MWIGNRNFLGMPQIQKMMDKAIGDLRKNVPLMVSNSMVQDAKQRGTGFRR